MASSFSRLLAGLLFFLHSAHSLKIEHLTANGLRDPLGRLQTTTPRLAWIPTSSQRGDEQAAFQVQASTGQDFANLDLWDSGKTDSAGTSIVYDGKALQSRDRAYWRVRAWDAQDEAGAWSEPAFFELGLMDQSDWTAEWIENAEHENGENALPIFAKQFSAACDVADARLYILGLGVQSTNINGKPVTDEVLAPSYSTMNTTLFYSTHDVTSLLAKGANTIGVELGKGIYNAGPSLGGRYTKFTVGEPMPYKVLAQLEYECKSGEKHTIISDDTWRTTVDGPYMEAAWYGGEEYDAERSMDAAFLPAANLSSWKAANLSTSPYPELNPRLLSPEMPPITVIEDMPVKKIWESDMGTWVLDFGQNFAGWFSFRLKANKGDRIVFYPAELIDDETLSVDQSSTGSPILDGYSFGSDSVEEHTIKFNYHGFRYLEIYGLDAQPALEDVVGKRVRVNTTATGSFNSDVEILNDIHRITDEAIQSNFHSVLTDCPHREKMGWLDQLHLTIEPVMYKYDIRGYGRHIIKNIVDAQSKEDGEVPTTAPQLDQWGFWSPYYYDQALNWGVAVMRFPWKHYINYGDVEILEENYEAMQGYLEFLSTLNNTYIQTTDLGDWAGEDQTTPFGLTGTGAYALAAEAMIKTAEVLNRSADVQEYRTLHKSILDAFNKAYFNAGNVTYASGSQASNAIALHIGATKRKTSETVTGHLVDTIRADNDRLSVGEVGLEAFFNMLHARGHDDVLFDVMTGRDFPSFGYMLDGGATTLWEHWDGAGSRNHFFLGYGDTWLTGLSGMRQASGSVGWQSIDFKPVIVGEMTSAEASYDSVKGTVSASWTLKGGALTYSIAVPVGSTGKVVLPAPVKRVKLDGQSPRGAKGIKSVSGWGKETVINVGSGEYTFKVSKISQ